MPIHEPKTSRRFSDTPTDRPRADRVEHANLDKPGARAHPRATTGWLAPARMEWARAH